VIEELRDKAVIASMMADRSPCLIWGDVVIKNVSYESASKLAAELNELRVKDHEGAVRLFVSRMIIRCCNE